MWRDSPHLWHMILTIFVRPGCSTAVQDKDEARSVARAPLIRTLYLRHCYLGLLCHLSWRSFSSDPPDLKSSQYGLEKHFWALILFRKIQVKKESKPATQLFVLKTADINHMKCIFNYDIDGFSCFSLHCFVQINVHISGYCLEKHSL